MGNSINVGAELEQEIDKMRSSKEMAAFISYLSIDDPVGAAVNDDWLRDLIMKSQDTLYRIQDEIKARGVDLDRILEDGIANKDDYKVIEELTPYYYEVFAALYYFIKLVNPMSAVGAERLEYFMDYEMELKDVLLLDKDDLDAFGPLIPAEFHDKVGLPEYFAFGAIRRENGESHPAGVILFKEYLDDSIEKICADLLWLNVRKKYEHKGVGDELMAMFFAEVNNAKADYVNCQISPMSENIEAFNYFMQRWGFFSDLTYSTKVSVTLKEIAESEYIKLINVDTSKITPLSELSDDEYTDIMGELEEKNDDGNDYYKYHVGREYYDPELSGVIKQKNNVSALFVHKNGAQEIELEIGQCTDNTISPALLLLAKNAIDKAIRKYTDSIPVKYEVRNETIANLTDKLFSKRGLARVLNYTNTRNDAFTEEMYDLLKEEVVVKGNYVDYLEPDDRELLDGLFQELVLQE
ncbi:hypothetical protein [Pseudobutyrivibrio sp. MD2005]|uniref:hypothetical protein n=1 Tax=Pseudobutyrivibrio sp. MD2005 TaxID=1410616 RepID=UPI000480B2B9|nr:hypothetical protein [Pseudobutyrivibrio sp. MD2005]